MARLPRDINGKAIQLPPTSRRIAPEAQIALTTAQTKSVEPGEYLEITARTQPCVGRWVNATDTTACTLSNFDIFVSTLEKERLIVPENVTGISLLSVTATSTVAFIRRR